MSEFFPILDDLPSTPDTTTEWEWSQFEPYADALLNHDLTAKSLDAWMDGTSKLISLFSETEVVLYNAHNVNTADDDAKARYERFIEDVEPHVSKFRNNISRKLVDSGLQPENFAVPLKKMRTNIEIFREENIPLFTQENKLGTAYYAVRGKQVVDWEGEEKTVSQLRPFEKSPKRDIREKAWRLARESYAEHRDEFDDLWRKFMDLRKQIATNAGFEDYRAYQWQAKNRFAYTPDDALALCDAVEAVVVPALARQNEKQRQLLGVDTLRPWDVTVDPHGREPLKPFDDVDDMIEKSQEIFDKIDPAVGAYFKTLRDENLLDLENRKNKAPGGYHNTMAVSQRSFIFANSVGLHADFNTLVHEMGHAYHAYQSFDLPHFYQRRYPIEFAEVASMSLELLATPYLAESAGGFYSDADAARARVEHLTGIFRGWALLAQGVRFQHWIYTHHEEATDPRKCDEKWLELAQRFGGGVDYSGLEDAMRVDWRRILHFFVVPFYLIEYAMARMGSVQIWANYLENKDEAFKQYSDALALGGTAGLADLFKVAGANFDFSEESFQQAVDLIEKTVNELEDAYSV